MGKLKGADRKYLRSLAHHLKPVVHVGKEGITDRLVGTVARALDAHELIKVKFLEFKKEKGPLIDEIGRRSGSQQVGTVGHVAFFYREHPDEEKRKIRVP